MLQVVRRWRPMTRGRLQGIPQMFDKGWKQVPHKVFRKSYRESSPRAIRELDVPPRDILRVLGGFRNLWEVTEKLPNTCRMPIARSCAHVWQPFGGNSLKMSVLSSGNSWRPAELAQCLWRAFNLHPNDGPKSAKFAQPTARSDPIYVNQECTIVVRSRPTVA